MFFLKVDTQGHSLPVIRSAKKRINCLACLIVEVEKIPAYKNSFSSSNIDLFLKKNNFFEVEKCCSKNFMNFFLYQNHGLPQLATGAAHRSRTGFVPL